jgi:hypothetical protein
MNFTLDELCKEQMKLMLLDVGNWIRFPETVHELYAHLAQFIGMLELRFFLRFQHSYSPEANENKGLKRVSEENLEVGSIINFEFF